MRPWIHLEKSKLKSALVRQNDGHRDTEVIILKNTVQRAEQGFFE